MTLSDDEIKQLKQIKQDQRENRGYVEQSKASDDKMKSYLSTTYVLRAGHKTTDQVYHMPVNEDQTLCDRAVPKREWRTVSIEQADLQSWDWCEKCRAAVAKVIES